METDQTNHAVMCSVWFDGRQQKVHASFTVIPDKGASVFLSDTHNVYWSEAFDRHENERKKNTYYCRNLRISGLLGLCFLSSRCAHILERSGKTAYWAIHTLVPESGSSRLKCLPVAQKGESRKFLPHGKNMCRRQLIKENSSFRLQP